MDWIVAHTIQAEARRLIEEPLPSAKHEADEAKK
jgi:hypothetical protein